MNKRHVHFIGIGGISMSGLAQILLHNHIEVSGSDMKDSHLVEELRAHGAAISIGHSAQNITDPDLVVYTAAIKDDNPELVEARRRGIEAIERAALLGELMKSYETAIAVAGTHGKTTTTSMLAHVLLAAGTDPTIMVGGELDAIGGNLRKGGKQYFLTEACEYHRSFLEFFPKIGIILNIEADHLDYFKDLDEIVDTFSDFAARLPKDGTLVIANDNKNNQIAAKSAKCPVVTVGLKDADYLAKNICYDSDGHPTFDVVNGETTLCTLTLHVTGKHNVYNALAAFACGMCLGFSPKHIKQGLESFGGAKRRFEKKGEFGGIAVFDDYAHHPTEIKATLKTAMKIPHNTLWCVFQPHTYTRTKALFHDFSASLRYADRVIITDIYAAREKDTGLVHAKDLADTIEGSIYIKEFSEIVDYLAKQVRPGDIVITMGAGNVYLVGEALLQKSK